MKAILLALFCSVSFNVYSSDSNSIEISPNIYNPLGVSFARMWNWVLYNNDGDSKEQPVLATAKCDYNAGKIFSSSASINTVIGRRIVNEAITKAKGKIVSSYGSQKHFVYDPINKNSGLADANRFLARELINFCGYVLRGFIKNYPVSTDVLVAGSEIQALSLDELRKANMRDQIEPNLIEIQTQSYQVNDRTYILALGELRHFSLNKIPINYSPEQYKNLWLSLISEDSCQRGEFFDGVDIRTNRCNNILDKLDRKIEARQGSYGRFVQITSSALCSVGRRFSGGLISNGTLTGALTCALTEVLANAGCESLETIVYRAIRFGVLTYAASLLPNGSDLKPYDLDFLDGGNAFRIGVRDKYDNLIGASIGAALIGYLTGKVYGAGETEELSSLQARGNTIGFLTAYIGLGRFGDDMYRIGDTQITEFAEYLSGAVPGYIQSTYRLDQCVMKLQNKLADYQNNSNRIGDPRIGVHRSQALDLN